jgi:hypothetical protein
MRVETCILHSSDTVTPSTVAGLCKKATNGGRLSTASYVRPYNLQSLLRDSDQCAFYQ